MNELKKLLVDSAADLGKALTVIDANGLGACFVVDKGGTLMGVISDGDARRALLKGASIKTPVKDVMNRNCLSLSANAQNPEILDVLNEKITLLPLVDGVNKIVDYASHKKLRRIPVAEPVLQGNELAYVTDAVRSTWISSKGKYVDKFQEQFTEYCQMPYALAVSNGTVALHLALVALDVGPGDEVILPDLTFAATINSVLYAGATPVMVDVDKATYNLRTDQLEALITERTKAIMPVHLYGYPADMGAIMGIAEQHNLIVLEDAAEALGSTYRGKPVGSFGDAATFSFFGNKTVTTGEGGMIVFRDKAVFERARTLRDHGMNPQRRYWHEEVGFNYRMTNLQAAIGVAQMERVDDLVAGKRNLARVYNEELSVIEGILLPPDNEQLVSSYWLYTVQLPKWVDRDQLIKDLLSNGVETRPVFYPLHVMPPYREFVREGQNFSGADHCSAYGLSLPSAASLTQSEARYIAAKLRATFLEYQKNANSGVISH